MDLIKEIRDISSEIETLKKSIANYDKQISKSQGTAKGLESFFNSAKISNSGRLEISGLEKAVGRLTERYKALEQTQDSYLEKQRVLIEARKKEKELVEKLAVAQREALRNGDQKGATDIYKQYVDANRSIAEMDSQIKSTKESMQSLHAQMEQTNGTLTRYESVLGAMKGSDGSVSIEKITAALREQEQDMVTLTKDMQDYASAIKKLQSDIANKNIAPNDMDAKAEELERWKYQLATLAERYTETAQTARDLATAAGMNPDGISMTPNVDMKGIELPKMTAEDAENIEKSADNMKKLKENADDASMSLEDIVNKGIKLGGLTYGAHKLVEFSKQVIGVRGEFQKLEVAFTTLLGSEQKANKLMQQLTKTAATTPFDLRSVSEGAKRLLAYGTAAEDVNDILIHLGDIAAGLSQPLDGLVYLYGTTMVQGKMMTRDLRQFQNRGIPIAEQLAKQFGVAKSEVQGLVSAGRVTADEFHKAVMGMASDGGKFAGLMSAQSKTIAGQISNIRDEMEMMFNEIGKSSEGVINAGLSSVSFLIENYEHVGEAIMALIGTYGVYKAALITVTALEAASAKIKYVKLTTTAKQVTVTKILTKEIWKQVAARMALNKTALIATAIIAGVGLATWGVVKALDAEARAQKALNKEKAKQETKQTSRKNSAKDSLGTLQSDTSTEAEKIKAYEELVRLVPLLTDKYNRLALSQMGSAKAEKELNKALEQQVKQDKIDALNKAKERYDYMERINMESAQSGVRPVFSYADFKTQRLLIQESTKELKEFVRVLEEANYNELSIGKKIGLKSADLYSAEQNFKKYKKMAEDAKKAWEEKPLNIGKTFETAYAINPNDASFYDYNVAIGEADKYEKKIKELKKEISILPESASTKGISEVIKQIVDAETKLNDARETYAKDENENTKLAYETAVANYEELTKKYKDMTGEQWTATKELTEQNNKLLLESEQEKTNLLVQEYDKRMQLAVKYQQDIENLEREKAEWRKKHPHRDLPSYFKQQEEVIELTYQADIKKLDKEFNEWIEDIEHQTLSLRADIDIEEAERKIDLLYDYKSKREEKNKLYEQKVSRKNADLDRERQKTAENQFGAETVSAYDSFKKGEITTNDLAKQRFGEEKFSSYEKYKSGEKSDWSKQEKEDLKEIEAYINEFENVFSKLEEYYDAFESNRSAIIDQLQNEHLADFFDDEVSRYEEYVQGMLDAETTYQQDLANIRASYGLDEDADLSKQTDPKIKKDVAAVTKTRDTAVSRIEQETGITKDKSLGDDLAALAGTIVGKTKTQVGVIYDGFIKKIKSQIENAQKELNGLGSGDIDAKKQELSDTISSNKAQVDTYKAQNPNATQEEMEELPAYQEMIAAEEQLVNLLNQEVLSRANLESLQRLLIVAEQERGKAVSNAFTTQEKANSKAEKTIAKQLNSYQKLRTALTDIRDAADSIADVFGDSLSKDGKKAIETISSIADVGTSAVEGIMTVVEGVSDGMIKTTEGASTAMQNLEKASFILTIISIAVQLIMKIVEIAQKFSTSNQLQEQVDAHLEQLERLKKAQQLVEAQYKTAQGSKYYEGLVKNGEKALAIYNKATAARIAAEQKLTHDEDKYGVDSEKAKEAAAQFQDLEIEEQEAKNEWILQYREIMEELSGTSLDSFAENLADALIEGFEMGKEGIDEVWEDTIDDILKTMMRNELALAIKDLFGKTFENFASKTGNGDLSEEEMEYFIDQLNAGKEKAKEIAEAYYNAMSEAGLLEDADTEGSEGFGQMTQDQADALTGRFTAVQIEMSNVSAATQAMANVVTLVGEDVKLAVASLQSLLFNSNIGLQMAQDQLDQLQVIADNTAMLSETNNRLKAIEQNTSRL